MIPMQIIYHHFDALVSTNDTGKEQLPTFPREALTVISAQSQTGGRGQYGRSWISPAGENIYASFCFFIAENQSDPLSLTHLLAINVCRLLMTHGITARIKWPNDVLVKHKKIAGILCETTHLAPYFGVTLGMGLNINMSEESLSRVGQPATSLFAETKHPHSPDALLHTLAESFANDLAVFQKEGFTPFLPSFRRLIYPTGTL